MSDSSPAATNTPSGLDLGGVCERFYPLVEQRVRRLLACDLRRGRPWLAAKVSTGDIVHEVFVSVLRDEQAIPTRSDQAIAAYLGRLVRNRLVDTLRHHQAARRDSRRTKDGKGRLLPAGTLFWKDTSWSSCRAQKMANKKSGLFIQAPP